ncbi:Oligoxyloglucan reducing end-specific cellobiohydrolase [Trametes coccinea BRFM310]|uniref:Vacuolar protein sorting/targeting protein 10 n=1 Tax=Trametes coccinea (strain BRFM310) TaxID=1353009 RepID=A0A1Y2IY62_TRAC3|nr:Oligoxyloglucan reducing end-specific cellobiohydrolase [Trametes coccinea BRFM310]
MALHHGPSLIFWLLTWLLAVAVAQPQSSISYFDNLPARLFFFDDTTNAVYHDVVKGNVHISEDEGKTWQLAPGVPEGKASMVVEHPFDNRIAFILSRSTTHWRTIDRGKTWQSFDMPLPPALVSRPLSFHSDPSKWGYVLYQGTVCSGSGWGSICHDETYYTKDAFSDDARLLLTDTSRCQFAHSSKDFKHEAHVDLIYCVAFDASNSNSGHTLASSRLFSSTDFFETEKKVEDLGIGKNARGIVAFAIVSKFAVVAMKDLSEGSTGDMLLYVTVDTKDWAKARFPHSSSARLRENAYTIVESTTHSLAVDVLTHDRSSIGTLFVSNSNGTFFVESLGDTNRNEMGYVDFENIYGVEGVGLANVVANAKDVEARRATKQLQTRITYDDGRSWSRLKPPALNSEGRKIHCNPDDENCSLHLHSVTLPHNFGRVFSSPAPGFVMGVGSIGDYLQPYEECDTFLSIDGGISWRMVRADAHKYEFGDQGSILVAINDEEVVESLSYSTDFGKTWKSYNFGTPIRARILTTVGDSTSQKFLLVGQIPKRAQKGDGRFGVVFLDFASLDRRKCGDGDFEDWNARSSTHECLMGHKQTYRRRKQDANCYVGEKFRDPVPSEEPCPCTDEDYECDYNYIRSGDQCVAAGPEPIPAGVCIEPTDTYLGSSGYRRIPGNTCDRDRGVKKDELVEKPCSDARPAEGQILHMTFEFPAPVVQYAYFRSSTAILVRLADNSIWQSLNEGYTWNQLHPEETFVAFYHHAYSDDRAYLITNTNKFYYTTDTGKSWLPMDTPSIPNAFGLPVLHFHPTVSDYIIWTGQVGCNSFGESCYVEAQYSLKNGRSWTLIDKYVRNCAWARDSELLVDPNQILCESYKVKEGNQRFFGLENPLELIAGTQFYDTKTKLFDHVVGFAKFSEFLIVAEYQAARQSLDIQVSLDGRNFAPGQFPPTLRPEQHAYTILESSTKSVFLHVTTSEPPAPYWGSILKSNSNGTYFGLSLDNVNRNDAGFVDFEKMINLDGIALVNIVGNPHEAPLTGRKLLQTRISHNDGGSWRPLPPPATDSQGNRYACDTTKCALHIHGYTERYDSRATYSTPSVPGLLMAVGSVGEYLEAYDQSDTFLSRDAGFTWEEVHKDAHLWEFGDSGSILVMANDEGPTDHVMFSKDEGLNWREYKFTDEPMRVKAIVTVPSDTSRRFILMGYYPRSKNTAVAVHIDFSALTSRKCVLDVDDANHDDFELWSPSEGREEQCLFGKQTLYHRRKREADCVVGDQKKAQDKIVKYCACTDSDFECEYNYERNSAGECVLIPGLSPRDPDPAGQCRGGEDYWYELTPYRKIPNSACEGGKRLDRGPAHPCPGLRGHGAFFWLMMLFIPVSFAALAGYWYYRRNGYGSGAIRLPGGETGYRFSRGSTALDTLASVPWFLIGLGGIAYEWVAERFDSLAVRFRGRSGYRNLPVDEDAQILRFEDEE